MSGRRPPREGHARATRPAFSLRSIPWVTSVCISCFLVAACDHGLAPPPEPPVGAIRAQITYATAPDDWPPADSLVDLRFVAMRFVPRDVTDFLDLNRLTFSEPLRRNVLADTVLLAPVETGAFVYAGVAQRYAEDLFAWRPVALYERDGGVFHVRAGETTDVAVSVDFSALPPFPPDAEPTP